MQMLECALAHLIPASRTWERRRYPPPSVTSDKEVTYCFEVFSPVRSRDRSLVIQLRHDRDIQVEYYIDGERKKPFEIFFILPAGQERAAIESIVAIVADILEERLVFVHQKGSCGERRFVKRETMTELDRRKLSRIISWLGSYDWRTPS